MPSEPEARTISRTRGLAAASLPKLSLGPYDAFGAGLGCAAALGAFVFRDATQIYLWALVAVILTVGFVSPRIAWALYVVALCTSGLQLDVAGFTLLPEQAALVPLAFHAVLRRSHTRRLRPSAAALVACVSIILWLIVNLVTSMAMSPDSGQSVRLLAWIATNLVGAILVFHTRLRVSEMVRTALAVMIGSTATSLGVWAISSVSRSPNLFVEQDYSSEFFRLQALMLEPNLEAALLVLGACVAVRFASSLPGALVNIYLLVALVGTVLTFTRVSTAVIIVVLFAYVWPRLRVGGKIFSGLIGAIVVLVLLLLWSKSDPANGTTLFQVLAERASGLFDFASGTGAYRARTAALAVDEILRHGMVTGHGFNAFPQLHESDQGSTGQLYLGLLWLVIFYDGGVVGAILFLAGVLAAWAAMGFRNGLLFMVGFALIATATNPIWYVFPWAFAILLIRRDEIAESIQAGSKADFPNRG